jgi:hypothetical protein
LGNATYLRRPAESEKLLYVIGRISEGEWSRVLCVTSASGAKTLPVFSHREAARRFLRVSAPRFRPEFFINRIDEVIVFRTLDKERSPR